MARLGRCGQVAEHRVLQTRHARAVVEHALLGGDDGGSLGPRFRLGAPARRQPAHAVVIRYDAPPSNLFRSSHSMTPCSVYDTQWPRGQAVSIVRLVQIGKRIRSSFALSHAKTPDQRVGVHALRHLHVTDGEDGALFGRAPLQHDGADLFILLLLDHLGGQ